MAHLVWCHETHIWAEQKDHTTISKENDNNKFYFVYRSKKMHNTNGSLKSPKTNPIANPYLGRLALVYDVYHHTHIWRTLSILNGNLWDLEALTYLNSAVRKIPLQFTREMIIIYNLLISFLFPKECENISYLYDVMMTLRNFMRGNADQRANLESYSTQKANVHSLYPHVKLSGKNSFLVSGKQQDKIS